MKKCTSCDLIKSLDDFYTNPSGKLKKQSRCKQCQKIHCFNASIKKRKPNVSFDFLKDEKFISFHPGYNVSNYGRIYRDGNNTNKYVSKKLLICSLMNNGYLKIGINNKTLLIHRLVAKFFVYNDDSENKTHVNHIDSNRSNNHYSNLEWVTPDQNVRHALKADRLGKKLNISKVKEIRLNILELNVLELAKKYSVSKTNIRYILSNKIWIDV